MSLQAVKAVEIGRGVTAAESFGSTVHDAIGYEGSDEAFTKFSRDHNNAGGLEGGISNGEDVVVRGYLEAHLHPASPAWQRQLRDPRAGQGRLRALRRLCRPGCWCRSRGHGRARRRTSGPRKVWR